MRERGGLASFFQTSEPRTVKKHLLTATYAVALLLILAPLLDTVWSIAPYRLGEVRWRFAASGLVSRNLLDATLGLLLAYAAAFMGGHRRTQRTVSVVTLLGAIGLVLGLILFVLDAVQLRAALNEAGKNAVTVALLAGSTRYLLVIVTWIILAMSAWRSSRRTRTGSAPAPLIGMLDRPADGQ